MSEPGAQPTSTFAALMSRSAMPLFMMTPASTKNGMARSANESTSEHLLGGGEHRIVEADGDDCGKPGGDADGDGDGHADSEEQEDPDEEDQADEGGDVHDVS